MPLACFNGPHRQSRSLNRLFLFFKLLLSYFYVAKSFLLLFTLFISVQVQAAPFPATSTSALIAAPPYFKSDLGFEIPRGDTGWALIHPDASDPYFLAQYKPVFSAPDLSSQLSIRVDPLKDRKEIEGKISLKS